jgi:hypothetical protein
MKRRTPLQIEEYKKKWGLPPYGGLYDQAAARWCLENGYKIYPEPLPGCVGRCVKFNLVVDYKGVKKKGTKVYNDKEWSDAIWNIYKFLYDKNGKKTKAV